MYVACYVVNTKIYFDPLASEQLKLFSEICILCVEYVFDFPILLTLPRNTYNQYFILDTCFWLRSGNVPMSHTHTRENSKMSSLLNGRLKS